VSRRAARRGPGAAGVTRRLFLDGALKATMLAGVAGRASLLQVIAAPIAQRRRYGGMLIEESYGIAHRLRDGTLAIPSLQPEGPLHDAIVVGGGVSGLLAAWELRRGGLEDVVLFEKEDYLGGNASKAHANGTDYTRATWSVARPRDPFLARLLQDLGAIEGFASDGTARFRPELVGPGPEYNTFMEGAWYAEPAGPGPDLRRITDRLPLSAKDRGELVDFFLDMQAWEKRRGRDGRPAFAMPVEEGSRDAEILELERITMADYAARRGWGAHTLEVIEEWSSSTIGGRAAEVSAYGFLSFNSLGQGGEDITLPGGNAWLAERLAERVGRDRLRSGLMAVRVENHGQEVRVVLVHPLTGRFTMRRARCAVLACPKHITARMVPELAAAGRTGWRLYQYGALLMGAASVRRTPVLKGAPLAWYNGVESRFTQGFLVADYNSDRWRSGDPHRPNVLCIWTPLAGKATRQELLDRPWSHWADRMMDDLEFMLPGITADLTRLDIYVWGHHMVIPTPGFLTDPARAALTRPLGRITFAHTDRHGMPSFELATRAGFDAAREAIALVRGATAGATPSAA
jgi:spermidine dehydrogenase